MKYFPEENSILDHIIGRLTPRLDRLSLLDLLNGETRPLTRLDSSDRLDLLSLLLSSTDTLSSSSLSILNGRLDSILDLFSNGTYDRLQTYPDSLPRIYSSLLYLLFLTDIHQPTDLEDLERMTRPPSPPDSIKIEGYLLTRLNGRQTYLDLLDLLNGRSDRLDLLSLLDDSIDRLGQDTMEILNGRLDRLDLQKPTNWIYDSTSITINTGRLDLSDLTDLLDLYQTDLLDRLNNLHID